MGKFILRNKTGMLIGVVLFFIGTWAGMCTMSMLIAISPSTPMMEIGVYQYSVPFIAAGNITPMTEYYFGSCSVVLYGEPPIEKNGICVVLYRERNLLLYQSGKIIEYPVYLGEWVKTASKTSDGMPLIRRRIEL